MFKTTIHNSTQQFRFQQEIAEASTVNTNIRTLLDFLRLVFICSSCLLGGGLDGLRCQFIFFFIIQQIVTVVSHDFFFVSGNDEVFQNKEKKKSENVGQSKRDGQGQVWRAVQL